MVYVRMTENKRGGYTMETNAPSQSLIDAGAVITFIDLPSLDKFPTPLLEDAWHEINVELQERDKKFVKENFGAV